MESGWSQRQRALTSPLQAECGERLGRGSGVRGSTLSLFRLTLVSACPCSVCPLGAGLCVYLASQEFVWGWTHRFHGDQWRAARGVVSHLGLRGGKRFLGVGSKWVWEIRRGPECVAPVRSAAHCCFFQLGCGGDTGGTF